MSNKDTWNKCDVCGRFIPFADFESEAAVRNFRYDSYGGEDYETVCAKCKETEQDGRQDGREEESN